MAKKMAKTNAVRLIEQQNISYELLGYKTEDGQPVDGISVSEKTVILQNMYIKHWWQQQEQKIIASLLYPLQKN